MNNILKSITALLCSGLLLTAFPFSAHAEDEYTLPSGLTITDINNELSENNNVNNVSSSEYEYGSAAIGIFNTDQILYTNYIGKTDFENDVKAGEDSVYEWGSISKTLIWVSAMQLFEQGKLDLERDVREYLPDGFFQHLSYDEPITMLNLMNHDAGWQETTKPIWETDENCIPSLKDALQAIEPAQVNPPGKISAYSNYGAAVAGYVIECVSGQDFCGYVHEHIFEPLGMEHTALSPAHNDNQWVYEQRKNMKCYKNSFGNTLDLGNRLYFIPCYPAGAAAGTLNDLMTYGQALMNDDAPLFSDPETQKLLFTATSFYGNSDIPICAHGFWCKEYSVRTYGHSGATLFGQADLEFDLDSKTGVALMINEPEGNNYIYDVPSLVFGDLPADKYAGESHVKTTISGYYTPARTIHHGILKFISLFESIPADNLGEFYDIGSNTYQIEDMGTAGLIGENPNTSGSEKALQISSSDLLLSHMYILKLCLLTVYILLAVISVYLLLIRRKLKKSGSAVDYSGSAVIGWSHAAKLLSVIMLLVSYMIFAKNMGGISTASSAFIGIVQMLCAAVCSAAAMIAAVSLFKAENIKFSLRYITSAVCNMMTVTAIIYFELYRFWV